MKKSMNELTNYGKELLGRKIIEKQVDHLVNTLNEYNFNPEEIHLYEMIYHKLALSRKVYTLEDNFVIPYTTINSLAENYEKIYNDYSKTKAFKGLCNSLNKFDTNIETLRNEDIIKEINKKQIALLIKDILDEKESNATVDILELFKNL